MEMSTCLFSRREHLLGILPAFMLYALLGEAKASAPGRGPAIRAWINDQQEIASALSRGEISGRQWAVEVERLARRIDVDELMAFVATARLQPGGEPSHNDPRKHYVRFLDEAGEPRRLAYGVALFDFLPSNVITPHGHKHMVSAHLVVAGRLRVRNFDRLRDEGEAMIIRPTRDYVAAPGDISTMCSERDNIHWFVPQGGPARTFDIIISGLDPGESEYDIRTIDPLGGRRLDDGSIAAPIIGFADSASRYTASV